MNRDVLRLNNVLRFQRGQEKLFAAPTRIPASTLPEWLRLGARCCYVSSSGGMHNVRVQKVDEAKQTVIIIFEEDPRNGKKVPFAEITKSGDGTLRPVWKASQQAATCAPPPGGLRPTGGGAGKATAASTAGPPAQRQVEDIPSSGDEGAAPAASAPVATVPAPAFVPRVVALQKQAPQKVEAGPVQGPELPPPAAEKGRSQRRRPQVDASAPAAEISDDEAAVVASASAKRRRSRSKRRPP